MEHKLVRIAIGVLAAFIALTAVPGGIAILTGIDPFPPEWLEGTPFHSYTIPALLLSIVVGGSSLIAAVTIFTRHKLDVLGSLAAGLLMAGYIVGEVLILNDGAVSPSWIEVLYLALGMVIAGLAGYLWIAEGRLIGKVSR